MSEEDKLQKAVNEAQWRKKQIEDERRLQELEEKKKRDEEEKRQKQKDEEAHRERMRIMNEQNKQREEAANKRDKERERQRQIEQTKENQRKKEIENKKIATAKTSPPKGKSAPPPQPKSSKTQSYGWLIGGIIFFFMVIGNGEKKPVSIPVKQSGSSTIPLPGTYPNAGDIPKGDTTVTISEIEPAQIEPSEDATIPPDKGFIEPVLREKTIVNTTANRLNLRQDPQISKHNIIAKIPTGEEVSLIEYVGEETIINGKTGRWCRIEYNGQQGYVFEAYLISTYR
jgi:flagellar biosynthesis GTPase FlhF